jgi:TRAP transporter TAXI family solute receptor
MRNGLKALGIAAGAALSLSAGAQQTVGFATLQPGTLLNAQASVIAKVVQDHSKLQVRVIGHGGDTGIIDAVNSKQADFLLLDVGEPAEAQKGENVWKGNPKPNLRAALTLFGFQMAFWVRKDSPIQSIADLKGKNIPSEWVQQTSVITHLNALLAAGGVTLKDVKRVPTVNVIRASEDFKSGKIDVFFFAVGAPKVQEISAAVGGLRVLNMEILPDSEKRMKAIRPEYKDTLFYYFSLLSLLLSISLQTVHIFSQKYVKQPNSNPGPHKHRPASEQKAHQGATRAETISTFINLGVAGVGKRTCPTRWWSNSS